jgi:hypothetical protein
MNEFTEGCDVLILTKIEGGVDSMWLRKAEVV